MYHSIELPSQLKCYPNVEEIKIRTLRGKDEELISELNPENAAKNILAVIENVVQGIEAKQLTSGDVMYILLWEAIHSFSSMCPFSATCRNCEHESIVEVDLTKVQSDIIPEEYVYPYVVRLQDGTDIKLRPQTIGDELELVKYMNKSQSTHLLKYALRMIETNLPLHERIELLENMSVSDLRKIKDEEKASKHGPDMLGHFECPSCKAAGQVVLPFRFQELFRLGG